MKRVFIQGVMKLTGVPDSLMMQPILQDLNETIFVIIIHSGLYIIRQGNIPPFLFESEYTFYFKGWNSCAHHGVAEIGRVSCVHLRNDLGPHIDL